MYLINSMKRNVNKILPENVQMRTAYTGKRLSTCSQTKEKTKTKFEHQHDIIHHVKCSAENCADNYIGEAARRVVERVKDHRGKVLLT